MPDCLPEAEEFWSEHKDLNLEPDGYKPPALPLRYVPVWCRPRESNPLESPWITDLQSVSPP